MNIFAQAWDKVASFVNPSNEQKALNALYNMMSVAKGVDIVIDPILSLYAPLGAVAKMIDEGIVIIQAAITNLEAVVESQKK